MATVGRYSARKWKAGQGLSVRSEGSGVLGYDGGMCVFCLNIKAKA